MTSPSTQAVLPEPTSAELRIEDARPQHRVRRPLPMPVHFSGHAAEGEPLRRDAELFYLQKQIQLQTRMVIVLEDGEEIEGVVEWYDRNSIKVRGRSKCLIYKSAIKYMYKHGDPGQ
jgi:sRNA-binding regulator protein Hfq